MIYLFVAVGVGYVVVDVWLTRIRDFLASLTVQNVRVRKCAWTRVNPTMRQLDAKTIM